MIAWPKMARNAGPVDGTGHPSFLCAGYTQTCLVQRMLLEGTVPKGIWGPPYWYALHMMAIAYPQDPTRRQALAATRQLLLLIERLPCAGCRTHAMSYVRTHPMRQANSYAFQLWAFRFHNATNRRLAKPQLSYDEYRGEYSRELAAAELAN